ncbi:MAE_28990/MAE_18760 family HEPN-like nuclease [Hymenobacter sp. AT01-02]|uniref:MAE_28990/MAE_18760 family HEPN-like nuclease n=1 Tax=Hymenobacter sp. AT01-02 TaxID=1571877 RepID=UPI000B2833A2|nr:MAE_28990/MAE_18760 family HEPN-like nuclease [Hymenobacter sp. AT01-02]
MSFTNVRTKARGRFSEALTYLNYIASLEPNNTMDLTSIEVKIMRGLFQVHLYAALEKTVNELIENTLSYISSNNIKSLHYANTFRSISHINKLKALRDCKYENFLSKSAEVFSEMESESTLTISETIFSSNLQNVWTKTILEVINVFGIKNFTIDPITRTIIDELVERRNAVAHGRESASVVGERFRTDVLRGRHASIVQFSNQLIDVFELYYNKKLFLKPYAKKHYSLT